MTPEFWIQVALAVLALSGIGLLFWQVRQAIDGLRQAVATGSETTGLLLVAVESLRRATEDKVNNEEAGEVVNLMAVIHLENTLAEALLRAEESRRRGEDNAELHLKFALDVLNRFCHCVRLGFVDENIYRVDYRSKIDDMIREHGARFDGTSTYQHTISVIKAWRDEKSAADRKPIRRSQSSAP